MCVNAHHNPRRATHLYGPVLLHQLGLGGSENASPAVGFMV